MFTALTKSDIYVERFLILSDSLDTLNGLKNRFDSKDMSV